MLIESYMQLLMYVFCIPTQNPCILYFSNFRINKTSSSVLFRNFVKFQDYYFYIQKNLQIKSHDKFIQYLFNLFSLFNLFNDTFFQSIFFLKYVVSFDILFTEIQVILLTSDPIFSSGKIYFIKHSQQHIISIFKI